MVKPNHIDERGPLSRFARAINRAVDFADSMRISRGIGYQVRHDVAGQTLIIKRQPPQEAVEAGPIKMVQIIENFGNYLTCQEYDAETHTSSGEVLRVAKPFRIRQEGWVGTTNSFTFNGTLVNLTYTWTAVDYRTARDSISGTTERQAIIPVYKPGWLLFIAEPENGTGVFEAGDGDELVELTWLDLNTDAREWCRY